jgi:hypothetical protein
VARASNGREARSEVPIVVDRTLAAFAAAPSVFSPNGDGRVDQLAFTFVLAAPARVKIRIAGGPTLFEGDLAPGAQRIAWGTRLRDGKHTAAIDAIGPFGPRLQRTTFVVDTVKPRLRLISGRAARFWASEAGTAVFVVGGRRLHIPVAGGNFTARAATGRRFTVVLWDRAGNRSSRVRFP